MAEFVAQTLGGDETVATKSTRDPISHDRRLSIWKENMKKMQHVSELRIPHVSAMGATTENPSNKFWWVRILPVGDRDETGAAGRLWLATTFSLLFIVVPAESFMAFLEVPGDFALPVAALCMLVAIFFARPIVSRLSPEILERGDESYAKRIAAQTKSK